MECVLELSHDRYARAMRKWCLVLAKNKKIRSLDSSLFSDPKAPRSADRP